MKKLLKTFLLAVCLLVGGVNSTWATTETFGASKNTTANSAITGTSVNIAGTSNPNGIGSYAVFNGKSDKGIKLRTGSALTLNVNTGYRVTGVTVYAYQNNTSTKTITCDSYSIDGATATNYSTAISVPLNVKNAETQTLATISTGDIDARTSVVFNFTNSGDGQNQIYAFIEVAYEEYTQIWNDDCSTKTAWKTHGTASETINVTTNNALVADNSYVNFKTNNGKDRSNYYSLSSASTMFANTSDYKFEFDLAIYGSNASNHLAHANLLAGNTTVFSIDCTSYDAFQLNAGTAITAQGIDVTLNSSSTRDNIGAATVWYHYTVISNATGGTSLTVEKWVDGAKTSAIATKKIANGLLNLTELQLNGGSYQQWSIDNLKLSINLEPYKTRASSAKSAYTAVKDGVMNSTVKSTLDGAKTSLDAFGNDVAIAANISGYISAIEALETANENAQTSINEFIILNDLITRANTFAGTVTSYEAPEGASTVYTSNADVDPVALAAAVRAEVIEEGVKNDNTDITAIIANSSFELGSTLGWTTIASNDTGAKGNSSPYTTSGIDGSWQFNTWSQGTPITQTIGTLPAGQYKLAALVASDGGTIYLKMNNTHNSGVLTSNGATYVDNEYTFTLASNTEVTIGAVGGNDDGSYTDDGHWWYKADKFTLTYVGQDPLALAKVSLEAEIVTATALYNSWTPKVGTTPFKYDATYYNALNTAIVAARAVIDADGDVVSAYTSAEDALETAESNMASSTQNAPDPDKYYQIFVANNDGTASDYNLYMLKETTKTQVTVSAKPYPVKITKPDTRYRIVTPYGSILCTDYTTVTKAYTNGWEGAQARCSEMQFVLNDNGSLTIQGNRGSGTWFNYSASASEGAGVTANTGLTGKWVISDAVDVTDVNLFVNATTGWGTFIAPYDNLIPSTVKAYSVSHKGSGYIYLEENETGVLSANTPYILSTEEASNVSVALKGIANNDKDTYENNGLVGLLAAKTVPADSYILQYQAGTAFYKLASDMTGTKYRCYLDLDNVPTSSSSRASVRMSIFDDETTGIENLTPALSEGEGVVYNLRGQRVAKPTKGLYIVNGQKVVVK